MYVYNIYIYIYINIYIYIYISVNPLPRVETNGLTNSRLPGLLLWKAARFLATSCILLLADTFSKTHTSCCPCMQILADIRTMHTRCFPCMWVLVDIFWKCIHYTFHAWGYLWTPYENGHMVVWILVDTSWPWTPFAVHACWYLWIWQTHYEQHTPNQEPTIRLRPDYTKKYN